MVSQALQNPSYYVPDHDATMPPHGTCKVILFHGKKKADMSNKEARAILSA